MPRGSTVPRSARRWPLAAAILAGGVHALSFAPLQSGLLQIASLAALLLLMADTPRPLQTFWQRALLPFAFCLTWFAGGLCWLYISMHHYGGLPMPMAAAAVLLCAAYLSIFPCAAMLLSGATDPRPSASVARALAHAALFGATWTLTEWLRGTLFTGFPWLAIGYAQIDSPLAGFAPILGVYGISGLAAASAALLASATLALINWFRAPVSDISVPAGPVPVAPIGAPAALLASFAMLLACGFALQMVSWSQPHGSAVRVRLVQGNVPQQLKFVPHAAQAAMLRYAELISAPAPGGAIALTVLPETAWTLPWSATPREVVERLFAQRDAATGAHPVAIGMPLPVAAANAFPGRDRTIANSVLLLNPADPADQRQRYDKHHLVPFGEFVPPGFQWFVNMMHIPLGSFARGNVDQTPFQIAGQNVAFNICYEDLFGEELAPSVRAAGHGATILINVSNIAWFGRSHALPQHLAISRMRSLELARPMLRATNTGMTASIDERGRIRQQLPDHTEGVLVDQVQGTTGLTPFARFGNALALLLALATLVTIRVVGTRTYPRT